jgi:addiction module toxin, RelE/StbE family
MLTPSFQRQFLKDLKLLKSRGKNLSKLDTITQLLQEEAPLPAKNRNHKLIGEFKDSWECHIEPDWLLIYRKTATEIIFIRTGSHSDLF